MGTDDRYLHFDNIDLGEPEISSRCSDCGQEFKASPKLGGRIDESLLQIRADFNAHTCHVLRPSETT